MPRGREVVGTNSPLLAYQPTVAVGDAILRRVLAYSCGKKKEGF